MALGLHHVSFLAHLLLLLLSVTGHGDSDTLLEAKATLVDPDRHLSGWTNATPTCRWPGVHCDELSGDVTAVDLSNYNLAGGFPSVICRLPHLANLSLGFNFLSSTLHSDDLFPCRRLRHLNLSANAFVGQLPDIQNNFSSLRYLDFSRNNFSGPIPPSYGRVFPSLEILNLYANFLTGPIPSSLGKLSQLAELNLAFNPFNTELPSSLGNLGNLQVFWIPYADILGNIPEALGNLTNLKNLDLSNNDLVGAIPASLGRLRNVKQIELYRNYLSGELPPSLGELSNLLRFDVSENNLSGKIPESLASLQLEMLGLNDNKLVGVIPAVISSNRNLIQLKLFNNKFSGGLPRYLGLNSKLVDFDVSGNELVGPLPRHLCAGGALQTLIAFDNNLSGEIPVEYGDCTSLFYVRIQKNNLSGNVPASFWGLKNLYHLEIKNNFLQGQIPRSISNARNLTKLLISSNKFNGSIPGEICMLSELTMIDAGKNLLSGELPGCIVNLYKLEKLDLQHNVLSGFIMVGRWPDLTELNFSSNFFSGEIPVNLSLLPVLTYLDLSNNRITGKIPVEISNMKLNILNLSDNQLAGEIPAGFDNRLYIAGLYGNPALCSPSGLTAFRKCPSSEIKSMAARTAFLVTVLLLAMALALLVVLLWLHKNQFIKKPKKNRLAPGWKLTSFQQIGFNESEILDSLKEENLIGNGGSGQVYKASLKSGQMVAVKRITTGLVEPGSGQDFRAEVETLGRVRHGNIVKLLFCCASEQFKVLVYEYMENGSLGEALYGEDRPSKVSLDWEQRAKIAIGAAQGLAYLHHDCVPPIVHRDVKPSNILLDTEFNAHLGDFGLARSLPSSNGDAGEHIMSNVAGSCGYIAPEYAYTLKVNQKSDVYSFGVVLLELVTGKKPIDPSFGENNNLVKWVSEFINSCESNLQESDFQEVDFRLLIDPRLLPVAAFQFEEMKRYLHVGLMCTSSFPMNRPPMRKVVELLKDRRDVNFFVPSNYKH